MSDRLRVIRGWNLLGNPLLQRYCRTRLRSRHFIPWALVVLIITLFSFLLILTLATRSGEFTPEVAARLALIPLLVIQGWLLMFVGTGTVSAGIVQESTEGMVEYQRLTPMTPMAKILGYLIGLPIREYLLALITGPFVVYAIQAGNVPWSSALSFYSVFFTSVLLYHVTGLVAGTVVKKKFLAGRTAQVLVLLLYLILPRFAKYGMVFLIYLTVLPAFHEQAKPFLGKVDLDKLLPGASEVVPWFQWNFSSTTFSLIVQGAMIFVLVVILARKWRDIASHLLGNAFSLLFFVGVVLLLIGNLFPLMDSGEFLGQLGNWRQERGSSDLPNAWITIVLIGLAFFALAVTLTHFITPTRDEMVRGFRRSKKLGRRWVAPFSDDASSFLYVLMIGLVGWLSWYLLILKILGAISVDLEQLPAGWPLAIGAAMVLPLLAYHAVLERGGSRVVVMAVLFVWIVPLLASLIMYASGQAETLALYVAGLSGSVLPIYAVLQLANSVYPFGGNVGNKLIGAFWVAIIAYAILVPVLLLRLRSFRQKLMRETGFRGSNNLK